MSQRYLQNRVVEVEDEDVLFEQYQQNSMEEAEGSQERVEAGQVGSELEGLEDSLSMDNMGVEVPKNVSPATSKVSSESPGGQSVDSMCWKSLLPLANLAARRQAHQDLSCKP
jgi:hypothetical protein